MPNSNAAHKLARTKPAHPRRPASQAASAARRDSGNGGLHRRAWSGSALGPEVEVTLKRPIPVDQTMQVVADPAGVATLLHADAEVASARAAELDRRHPGSDQLRRGRRRPGQLPGVYPEPPLPQLLRLRDQALLRRRACACSPAPSATASSPAPGSPPPSTSTDQKASSAPEFICAALDCPGAWGLIARYGIEGPFVLGRMTYRLTKPIYAGERYVVQGWALGREGRKLMCGTAVHDAEGELCAVRERRRGSRSDERVGARPERERGLYDRTGRPPNARGSRRAWGPLGRRLTPTYASALPPNRWCRCCREPILTR